MRDLKRNQQTFYYALYSAVSDAVDTNGKRTGEKSITYSEPVQMKANISPSGGMADIAIFGVDLQYSKKIVTCDTACPITETSVLWIDKEPIDSTSHVTPYNYVVKRVAKSLNNIVYAIDQVELR